MVVLSAAVAKAWTGVCDRCLACSPDGLEDTPLAAAEDLLRMLKRRQRDGDAQLVDVSTGKDLAILTADLSRRPGRGLSARRAPSCVMRRDKSASVAVLASEEEGAEEEEDDGEEDEEECATTTEEATTEEGTTEGNDEEDEGEAGDADAEAKDESEAAVGCAAEVPAEEYRRWRSSTVP